MPKTEEFTHIDPDVYKNFLICPGFLINSRMRGIDKERTLLVESGRKFLSREEFDDKAKTMEKTIRSDNPLAAVLGLMREDVDGNLHRILIKFEDAAADMAFFNKWFKPEEHGQ